MENFKWEVYFQNLPYRKKNSLSTAVLKSVFIVCGCHFKHPNEINFFGDSTDVKPFTSENYRARIVETYKIWFGEMSFAEACLYNQTSLD